VCPTPTTPPHCPTKVVTNISNMYYEDHIYCYIGNVVISMNPFKDLPIYDDVSVAIFLLHRLPERACCHGSGALAYGIRFCTLSSPQTQVRARVEKRSSRLCMPEDSWDCAPCTVVVTVVAHGFQTWRISAEIDDL
jgi:hypothetical protein